MLSDRGQQSGKFSGKALVTMITDEHETQESSKSSSLLFGFEAVAFGLMTL
jgi:hypothetical protein